MKRRARPLFFLALASAALADPATAAAHTCMTPVRARVDQPAVVTIGVPAEGVTPLVSIDLIIPDGFVIEAAPPLGGWQSAVDGRVVHYTGGQVASGACAYLAVKGTPTKKGTLVVPIHTRDADGTERDLTLADPQSPRAGQVIDVVSPSDGAGSGRKAVELAVPVAVVAGLLAWLASTTRRRRAGQPALPPALSHDDEGADERTSSR
jgi:hypothetical protein